MQIINPLVFIVTNRLKTYLFIVELFESMYIKQSVSLAIISASIALSAGIANADDMHVKAGNTSVSIQNGRVEVNSNTSNPQPSSWLNRLNRRIFGSRNSRSTINNSSSMKCDRSSSSQSSSSSSGGIVSRTSSSSTTMTCN